MALLLSNKPKRTGRTLTKYLYHISPNAACGCSYILVKYPPSSPFVLAIAHAWVLESGGCVVIIMWSFAKLMGCRARISMQGTAVKMKSKQGVKGGWVVMDVDVVLGGKMNVAGSWTKSRDVRCCSVLLCSVWGLHDIFLIFKYIVIQ